MFARVDSNEKGPALAATNSVCVVGGVELIVYCPERLFGLDELGTGIGRREAEEVEVVRERGEVGSSGAVGVAGCESDGDMGVDAIE